MLSDIEIAQATKPKHINDVAKTAGIPKEYIEQCGKYKAKIDLKFLEKSKKKNGKLILVTAMTPTPDIMTMPGLPKHPAAEKIDVDEDGKIIGLF